MAPKAAAAKSKVKAAAKSATKAKAVAKSAAKSRRASHKRPPRTSAEAGLTADAPGTVARAPGALADSEADLIDDDAPLVRPGALSQGCASASAPSDDASVEQAGLAAGVPRTRNAFHLFYAKALKSKECANAREASKAWASLGPDGKQEYHDMALLEKQEQLRVKSSLGIKIRHTNYVRKAYSSEAGLTARVPTPDSETVNVVAGSWELQWVGEPGKQALAGKGSFGSAYLGIHRRTGMYGAVKMFSSQDVHRRECAREVDMYMVIQNHDVQRLFLHVLESGTAAIMPYFVVPWAGVSLHSYLGQLRSGAPQAGLTASVLLNAVVVQTAEALQLLHNLGIVHTDLKPGNLMVDTQNRRIVVIDFNASERPLEDGWAPSRGTYATYPYRAPELWASWRQERRVSVRKAITAGIDVWAYGIVCVETLREGQSLFGSSGCETATERTVLTFASSANALEKMVGQLPDAVRPLTDFRNTVRHAMQTDPRARRMMRWMTVDTAEEGLTSTAVASTSA